MATVGIILLAAGSSGRLGKPKQLLSFHGQPLLQHLVNEARATKAKKILVVSGYKAKKISRKSALGKTEWVFNKDWKEGVASSIRRGITGLRALEPALDAAILMNCDQPLVDSSLLNKLIYQFEKTGKPIVASMYDQRAGLPALFHLSMFPELLQLTGDKNVEKIISIHSGNTVVVPFAGGKIDIDTVADQLALSER